MAIYKYCCAESHAEKLPTCLVGASCVPSPQIVKDNNNWVHEALMHSTSCCMHVALGLQGLGPLGLGHVRGGTTTARTATGISYIILTATSTSRPVMLRARKQQTRNQIGATNPNADTRNADIVKKISRRKGIFIRPNDNHVSVLWSSDRSGLVS